MMDGARGIVIVLGLVLAGLATPSGVEAQGDAMVLCDECLNGTDLYTHQKYHGFGQSYGYMFNCATGSGCHEREYGVFCTAHDHGEEFPEECYASQAALEVAEQLRTAEGAQRDILLFALVQDGRRARVDRHAGAVQLLGCGGEVVAEYALSRFEAAVIELLQHVGVPSVVL